MNDIIKVLNKIFENNKKNVKYSLKQELKNFQQKKIEQKGFCSTEKINFTENDEKLLATILKEVKNEKI